jgi:hypothetical protein
MKFCKDCEHHFQGLCLSPENGQDPVTGGVKALSAAIARSDITLGFKKCGSSGDFFVPKVTYHQWWAFWRKLA